MSDQNDPNAGDNPSDTDDEFNSAGDQPDPQDAQPQPRIDPQRLNFGEPDPNVARPSISFFEEDGHARGPARRDSQAWNTIIQQASKQADFLKTPSKGNGNPFHIFQAQNKVAQPSSDGTEATIIVDGRPVTTSNRARDLATLSGRTYDKTKRVDLSPENLQAFLKSANTYVLPKYNKLAPPVSTDAEGHLKAVSNLGTQLRVLQRHLIDHDMIDVFTIVIPKGNVSASPAVAEMTSLFTAYPRLHVDIVANSNTWYHLWATEPYFAENLNYSYELLRKNTDDDLWLKCQEDYEDYSAVQRGGPLMLFLILRRIQDVSESAIDHVKQSLVNLKIRDIPGEDVDKVVSLIKSAHALFKSASSSYHSYIPEDFPKMVLNIFQTTSVPEFNETFHRELQLAQHEADKNGHLVQWPTVTELTNLATNSYKRMTSSKLWLIPPQTKKKALTAAPPGTTPPTTPGGAPRTFKCFNCGGDHLVTACKKPIDEAKVEAARRDYIKNHPRNRRSGGPGRGQGGRGGRGGRGGPPRRAAVAQPERERTVIDGQPHIKNSKGVFVLDQKKVREIQQQERDARLAAEVAAAVSDSTSTSSPHSTAAGQQPPHTAPRPEPHVTFHPSVNVASREAAVKSVLQRYASRS